MADERNDSQGLPVRVTAYITALVKKMRYRRKVREDVRAEITAHFEDELRDCKTDEEKEQKTRRLLAEFGDLKLLAILFRRDKKRCRPLWRTVVARTFQGIGILLLCLVFYGIWFSCGRPTIRVDYIALLNQINQPDVRNENNAWPHYENAIQLYVSPSPLVEQFISYRHEGKDREEAIWLKKALRENEKLVQAWLEENQKHWDNLTADQQKVLLKCFEYDWVPFPKTDDHTYTEWQTTTFHRMVEHLLRCIKENTELTTPHPRGSLPKSAPPGFPIAELKRWLQDRTIPPNELEAVSVAVLCEAIKRFKNFPEDEFALLTDVERESIGTWIAQNEPAWRQFLAASEKAYCYRPYFYESQVRDPSPWYQSLVRERSALTLDLQHLSPLRKLTWLGIWRCRFNVSYGRTQQGLDECLAVTRAGSHWNEKATVTEQLFAQSMSRAGYSEILQIVSTHSLSAGELERLRRQLSQLYPEGYPLLNVKGERLAFLDVIQRLFTEGGPGGGHLIPDQWVKFTESLPPDVDANVRRLLMPLYTAASMAHAGRDETIAKVNEIFEFESKTAGMTPYERHICDIPTVDEMVYKTCPPSRFFVIHLLPTPYRSSEFVYWNKALYEATITILALKQWRIEKGAYPPALCELVKDGFLKALPMDPCSDKPLVYRKTGDDFILYGVSMNFTDDGGQPGMDRNRQVRKWADNGDMVFWPLSK
ncbi:MAG: hypothetical protein A2Z25_01865 [Planctomycetes bacterium RBG_16_55_9]|nr:MAG: hypothetical protein A2Z25_01865 [Planctomycetes bacterium RBG_16_55_9]